MKDQFHPYQNCENGSKRSGLNWALSTHKNWSQVCRNVCKPLLTRKESLQNINFPFPLFISMYFSYFASIFEGVHIILWYIIRWYFRKFGCVFRSFLSYIEQSWFSSLACSTQTNFSKFSPLFSTARKAEKEKIYHCIHNFVSHCISKFFFLIFPAYFSIFS